MGKAAVGNVAILTAAIAWIVVAGTIGTSPAEGQSSQPATVIGVSSGDTLTAQTADGNTTEVRLLGIDAPEPTECGGRDARAALRELASDRAVTMVADPSTPTGGERRSELYVDRTDGLDLGRELVRLGWATVIDRPRFARLPDYRAAEIDSTTGVWSDCDGDFHLTRAEQRRALGKDAKRFVGRYYRHVSNKRFKAAWRMLGRPAKRKLGHGYRAWRSSHRSSLGVSARTARVRVSSGRAVVTVRLRTRDRDVCNGRTVSQRFRGSVVVASRQGSLSVVRFAIRKTAGRTPRSSKSQCPAPKPPPTSPSPPMDCQGYSPCLPPGPDVDCAGGSGDGPRYVQGPVYVTGSDPYGLDGDGDGVGCES